METALERSADARDIAKDLLRRLPDYDGNEDMPTGRHELPQPQRIVIEQHTHLHSQPDLETDSLAPVKKQAKSLVITIVSGIGLAILTGVAALAQSCGHH